MYYAISMCQLLHHYYTLLRHYYKGIHCYPLLHISDWRTFSEKTKGGVEKKRGGGAAEKERLM